MSDWSSFQDDKKRMDDWRTFLTESKSPQKIEEIEWFGAKKRREKAALKTDRKLAKTTWGMETWAQEQDEERRKKKKKYAPKKLVKDYRSHIGKDEKGTWARIMRDSGIDIDELLEWIHWRFEKGFSNEEMQKIEKLRAERDAPVEDDDDDSGLGPVEIPDPADDWSDEQWNTWGEENADRWIAFNDLGPLPAAESQKWDAWKEGLPDIAAAAWRRGFKKPPEVDEEDPGEEADGKPWYTRAAEKVRGERFPTSEKFLWLREMADVVRARVPEHAKKVPSRPMPNWLVRLLALFMDEMKQIKGELGNVRDVSGKHTEQVLGYSFIPAEQTIEDTVRSLFAKGIVKP